PQQPYQGQFFPYTSDRRLHPILDIFLRKSPPRYREMDLDTSEAATRPLTPQDDTVATEPDTPWVPHDVPYNEAFEDAIMTAVLEESAADSAPGPATVDAPSVARHELPLP